MTKRQSDASTATKENVFDGELSKAQVRVREVAAQCADQMTAEGLNCLAFTMLAHLATITGDYAWADPLRAELRRERELMRRRDSAGRGSGETADSRGRPGLIAPLGGGIRRRHR